MWLVPNFLKLEHMTDNEIDIFAKHSLSSNNRFVHIVLLIIRINVEVLKGNTDIAGLRPKP